MKLTILTLAVVACLAITSCGSNKNSDGELDSNVVDTGMNAGMDTNTVPLDTNQLDTSTMPKDSTGMNQ